MRSNIKPENRRLLDALYYIDEEVLADVLADVTVPEPSAPAPRKRAVLRSVKYAALLAACALLIGAVFPVITQLVNYFGEGTGTTPPVGSALYSEYADYVLTEDDLAAINAAWAKEHTSVFADSIEDAMRRTQSGEHYFGKYGDTIVIWRSSIACAVLTFSMNGNKFTFGTGTMYFFNGGNVYDQYEAGSSGLLTDEQIEALYQYYTDEYLYYGDSRIYTYPIFVPDLEYLSQKAMKEVNDAYDTWKYNKLFEDYSTGKVYTGMSAEEYIRQRMGNDPHRFFNEKKYDQYQYYGKFGDCVVLATENHFFTLLTVRIAGYDFELGGTGELIVYREGEIISLSKALEDGYMTEEQIGKAHERYLSYHEYLDVGNKQETAPAPETTEEKFEVPIPEGGLTFIEHVGGVPAQFKSIVENNIFGGGYLMGDLIVKSYPQDGKWHVTATDFSGKTVTDVILGGPTEIPREIFVDSEKNLIIVLRVDTTVGSKPSGHYKVVKVSPNGKIVFELDMRNVAAGYDYMIEVDGGYIFVGGCDGTRGAGNIYTNDLTVMVISDDGAVKFRKQFGGNDSDTLYAVQKTADGISVYFYMHVRPVDAAPGGYKKYDFGFDGNLLKCTDITEDDIPKEVYFYIDGKPYYNTEDFFTEFEWNKSSGSKVIEYDDFVLFVYGRYTSDFDVLKHGMLSTIPISSCYTETVYEGYTKSGELLWRTAVDSTSYSTIKKLLEARGEYN